VQRVTSDIEAFKFNTAVAALMEGTNTMVAHYQVHGVTAGLAEIVGTFVRLLAPFTPHIAEELWERMGQPYSVHQQQWPEWDKTAVTEDTITLIVQVDGRVRERLQVPAGIDETGARARALQAKGVCRHIDGRQVTRVVYVPGRLINIVTA
jgi:leucyl-tRNA synthetase